MNIGYACLTVGVLNSNFRNITLKNLNKEKLLSLIEHNLNSLENIIDYNIKNNIKLFRISSDLIPFGSSPANDLKWWEVFEEKLSGIGNKINKSSMRVSMHPGQYTVLNSLNEDVVSKAVLDLDYHNRVLDSLSLHSKHKIILHIGGIYDSKNNAVKRFCDNYKKLSDGVKNRLVIENDDKMYNIGDVLQIGNYLNIPVVYDNLHNKINCYDESKNDVYWINECSKTWKMSDGNQKIHYSQQDADKKAGSHSKTIFINRFMDFYNLLENDLDIMLEVKDKNLSAVKCINCTCNTAKRKVKLLEEEWSRYKYTVLEKSPSDYLKIRNLLKNKEADTTVEFYNLIEQALYLNNENDNVVGNAINALEHVWGYFKNSATETEKKSFFRSIENYKNNNGSVKSAKNILNKMAVKYEQEYLFNSYYFIEF